MKVLLTHLLGDHSQGHSWLVVSFVSEQNSSWQGFVTLTRDENNSTQRWNSWQSESLLE